MKEEPDVYVEGAKGCVLGIGQALLIIVPLMLFFKYMAEYHPATLAGWLETVRPLFDLLARLDHR